MLTLSDSDNGRSFSAQVGDTIELHLAENATTGYRWAPDHVDAGRLELIESTANYPEAAPGSGGETIFRFRVLAAGSGTIAFKYWRSWEGDKSVIQRFAATITITALR